MWLNSWKEGIAPQNEDFLLPRHDNEVNHEAKVSVGEEVRDPKQL